MALLRADTGSEIYDIYVSVIRGRHVIPVLLSRATGVETRVTVCSSLVQSLAALMDTDDLLYRANSTLSLVWFTYGNSTWCL